MASQTSLKELSKAINAYIVAPTLPLPDDLVETIAAYLRRHPKYDEAAADRLQEELFTIFNKHVKGNLTASAPWIAILRGLLPMIQTSERLVLWLDSLDGILSLRTSHDKGIVDQTVAGLMDIVSIADEYQEDAEGEVKLNPIMQKIFDKWMNKFYPGLVAGIQGMEYNERMFRDSLVQFGKKRPLQFFASLDGFFVQAKYRKAALRFLCDFIQTRPPHLHQILDSPLFGHLLTCLQEDMSTSVISSALTALIMLLPHMPSSLVPHLPALFNIYARLLFWSGEGSETVETPTHDAESSKNWEVCNNVPGVDDASIAHLANYYTILYGLYPLNFMEYIRKPLRYLRHANAANAEDFDIQATELRDQSDRFRRQHLLHPNFYTLTLEAEKTDFGRWIKSEAAEVVADCMALCLPSDPLADFSLEAPPIPVVSSPPITVDGDKAEPEAPLLSNVLTQDIPMDSSSVRANSTTSLQTMTRADSHSSFMSTGKDLTRVKSHDSDAHSVPVVKSPSQTQLQNLIQSNKAIKSGLHASSTHESEGSAPPSHRDSLNEQPSHTSVAQTTFFQSPASTDTSSQVAHLQRQNLMLQNDLSFERYQKQQHIAHIGELRRKQVAQAATEAETQNLLMTNRNLKSRYEEAKKAEMQVRKESEKSRALAKKWEADLSAKLKNLREQSKETNSELQRVRRELDDATKECDKLRKLVCVGEVKELNWKQNLQSQELHSSEISKLKAEVERLTVSERDNQAKEQERLEALESALFTEQKAEMMNAKLAARDVELRRVKKLFEAQVRELHSSLSEAQQEQGTKSASNNNSRGKADVEAMMAGSRLKQAEMEKQYDTLMRKYTALQSSLLDMQSGATPEQIKMEASSVPMAGGDSFSKAGTSQPKSLPRSRGLSNSDLTPDGTAYNVTPPLEKQPVSSPGHRPATPSAASAIEVGASSASPDQRYFGRGGVQNRIRKEGKDRHEDGSVASSSSGLGSRNSKKEKKSTGLRGIRSGVGEFVRGKSDQ